MQTGKTIDQITRTLTAFDGTERIPGRDGSGDFKATVASLVLYATSGGLIKEIDDDDYTILDTDVYKIYIFKNLTADRYLYLPTHADNNGVDILVINDDGSYNVIVSPEGSDSINDWNSTVEITEKYGWWRFIADSERWIGITDGWSTIYEVSSETADTGLALDGSWDDVDGMSLLNGVYGKGYLYAFASQFLEDLSQVTQFRLYWGIGKTAGNNAPDIKDNLMTRIRTGNEELISMNFERHIDNFEYESDGSTIYMKARAYSTESLDKHYCYGDTNCPMYIKWRRVY
jgi:hypothetical protein